METCGAAVTIHDPKAKFLPGFERAEGRLAGVFAGGAAVVTRDTDERTQSFVEERLHWKTLVVEPDGRIGLHRRMAVELALAASPSAVLYSDADHLLRWIEAAADEVETVAQGGGDFVIVGRSEAAMRRSPARLRETERIVNHIYELMTGNAGDLMFAVRRLSNRAAAHIIEHAQEESIANDVEWPLLASLAGYPVTAVASDNLDYRTREDFDALNDERDTDPSQWIARVEIARLHVQAMKRFL